MRRWFDALRWSPLALALQAAHARARRARLAGERTRGHCPVCDRDATFAMTSDNHREDPLCLHCGSVPRQRALVRTLAGLGIDLARSDVHEASPSLGTFAYFRRRSRAFTASLYLPGVRPGARVGVFANVDLQQQPFGEGTFDLVVTMDVLEHLPEPFVALREIQRTLRPGGRHVFTVPRRRDQATCARAVWRDGRVEHLLPAEYHRDPSTRAGSLVVTDWGTDLEKLLAERAGLACTAAAVRDATAGILSPIEVFVAQRPE